MSFILDALKKSESDRQRQSGPSLFEVKIAPPRRTLPLWAVAIAVLLGINVVVISWMLLRHPAPQQAATVATAPAAAPPTAALSQAAPAGAVPLAAPDGAAAGAGERPLTPSGSGQSALPPGVASGPTLPGTRPGTALGSAPSGPAGAASAAVPVTPVGTAPATPSAAMTSAATRAGSSGRLPSAAPLASEADQSAGEPPASDNPSDDAPAVEPAAAGGAGSSGAASGDLPLYQQIVGNDGLPALHLDLHVFADRPKDRFVMINMHRLGEGDSLPSGVQVDAIRPDGVVLTYHGTRFLLPRN